MATCSETLDCSYTGTTKLHRLEENLSSVTLELTSSDLCKINEAASRIKIQGDRYPEQLQKMTGR